MSLCLKYQGWIYFPDIERKEGKQEGRAEEKERRAKEKKKTKVINVLLLAIFSSSLLFFYVGSWDFMI